MKAKLIVTTKIILFCVILMLLLSLITFVSKQFTTKRNILFYNSFEENSIDIAFIGSSTTYRYYDVLSIWDEYNITSLTYTSMSMPFSFNTGMIEIIQQTQSPEIYVFELRNILEDEFDIKYLASQRDVSNKHDYTFASYLITNPFNKVKQIYSQEYYSNEAYIYALEFPATHSRFSSEIYQHFVYHPSYLNVNFLGNENIIYRFWSLQNIHDNFEFLTDYEYTLSQETQNNLTQLFDYCDENNINAFFTFTPYVNARNTQDVYIRNAISDFVIQHGYPMKDFMADFDEIGLEPITDFYDDMHVNAIGAKKYSLYAIDYFLQAYTITPQYSNSTIELWQNEHKKWLEYSNYQLPKLIDRIELWKFIGYE